MVKRREEIDRLRGLSETELREEADRLKESLFRLNYKLALGEMDAVKNMRREKKSLARIRTMIEERAREQSAAAK